MKNILLIVSAFLLFQTAALAQGAIGGRVLNAKTADGVANVTVHVIGSDGKEVATVTSDENGGFTFEDLDAGTYKILVRDAKGFQPAEQANITVEDDETATVSLKLIAAIAVTPQGGGNTQTGGPPKPKVTTGCTTSSASISRQFSTVNVNWVNSFDGNTILSNRKVFMAGGIVKWFNECKGFGFITPHEGGEDIFFHFSAIMSAGYKSLMENQRVSFDVITGPKGKQASNIQPI